MSDTVINRPIKIKEHNTIKGKGLTIDRIYTTEGVHPYDEVKWERRDVVQSNWKTGETVFEQRDVEFADFWSVNASTIVTTKYFRGAVGAENREWSLKQVIDRVVPTQRPEKNSVTLQQIRMQQFSSTNSHTCSCTKSSLSTPQFGLTSEQLPHSKFLHALSCLLMTLWIQFLIGTAKKE
jgi:hypothetical protein